MDINSEQNIIKQIKLGHHDQFKLLVDQYAQPLLVFVSNMMNSPFHAEDILQETFLAAFNNIKSYSSQKASFSTWIFTIAKNKCINEFKKTKSFSETNLSNIACTSDTNQEMTDKEIFVLLDNALAQLSEDEKTIFILAEIQEFTYEEVQKITDINIGTIKSKLSRTKIKLRDLLKKNIGGNHEYK